MFLGLINNFFWQNLHKYPNITKTFMPSVILLYFFGKIKTLSNSHCTLPRSKLNISWKLWKLHTKFISTDCKDDIRRTTAAFLALANIFLITSEGWFWRASCNVVFKFVLFEESPLLHSETVTRLEVLGEKISTGPWLASRIKPKTSADPIKVLIWASPLMETLCWNTCNVKEILVIIISGTCTSCLSNSFHTSYIKGAADF